MAHMTLRVTFDGVGSVMCYSVTMIAKVQGLFSHDCPHESGDGHMKPEPAADQFMAPVPPMPERFPR